MNSLDKYSEKEWNKYIRHNSGVSIKDMEEVLYDKSHQDCEDDEACSFGTCSKCNQDIDAVENKIYEAQKRKDTPVFSGVLKYFPNAIKEVSKCSKAGNDQHHPDKPLHWDMSKSKDEYDALARHLIDHTIEPVDKDGILHLTKVAWRALAGLERHLTNNH